jgi:hypothetical protein
VPAVQVPIPEANFISFGARTTPYVKVGRLWTFQDAATLDRAWRDFEIPGPPPEADFEHYVVSFFAEYDRCYGGNGGREIDRLSLDSDGHLEPEFVRIPNLTCEEAYVRFKPTVLHAFALRRDFLPAHHGLSLGPARIVLQKLAPASEAEKKACLAPLPPASRPGEDSVLSLPEPGETTLQYLSDDRPVFVVRHADGAVDVFATDTPSIFDLMSSRSYPLHGFRNELQWNCSTRHFHSVTEYDEYGRPVGVSGWPSLDRYRTVPVPDGSLRVLEGARISGYDSPRLASHAVTTSYAPILDSYASLPRVDLATTRTLPLGSRVRVNADLVIGIGAAQKLCRTSLASRSEPTCVPAFGLTWTPTRVTDADMNARRASWRMDGPFDVRIVEGGLSEVTKSWGGAGPEWEDRRYHQYENPPEFAGTLAGFASYASKESAAGGEASVSGRVDLWPRDPRFGWTAALVGQQGGIALRSRWLLSLSSRSVEYRLGVAPIFESPSVYYEWVFPSLLGLALPEVGVGRDSTEIFPYLAWLLPVVYHFESRRLRRHPYDAADTVGIHLAPTVMTSFRHGGTDVMYGGSLGAHIW